MRKPFVHLHVHSHYSLLDGLATPAELAALAKEQNAPAVALTDHGNMHGVVEFFKACKKEGVKPIIGAECYLAKRSLHDKEAGIDNKSYHLLLLVKNEQGYRNLVKLVSTAYLEGIYYKPRIDFELLAKHAEGLIATSACLAGEIPRTFLQSGAKAAKEVAQKYLDLFGEDFYLELQHHPEIPEQGEVNQFIKELSQEMKIPLIATNDIHYARAEDNDAHDTLLCIQTNAMKDEENRMNMTDGDYSMKHPDEMWELFGDTPEALENTIQIAEKCNFEFEFGKDLLPKYVDQNGLSDDDLLRQNCAAGIQERYSFELEAASESWQQEIKERLEYELKIIIDMGFSSYFLIVEDFVKWSREHQIAVGPGRGSAAGSLIAYVLKITDLDPIKHELIFERFLNPERVSMPDIDLDFADDRRDEVIEYVSQKYGADKVAQICTFGTMAARAAIKDVGRVFGISFGEMNDLVKLIPDKPGTTLNQALEISKELRDDLKSNPQHQKIFDTALKLEGCVRHVSVHACAVIISPDAITKHTPLQHPPKDESTVITQFSAKPLEAMGLLKMDFLGLRNITILEKAKKIIMRTQGADIDFDHLDMADEATFKLLAKGDTVGVFQLESAGMRRYLKELKPTDFEDIVAMVSLFRPGPMEWIPDYIAGKHGKKKVKYVHESLKPILEKTFGIAIYQEQILKIAQVFGGFSLGEADLLRRAIGKKIPEELAAQRQKFIDGAVKKGNSEKLAITIFEKVIEPFAGYGFNRSHAACYALIAYRTAYLKANYPTEFMAALLSCDAGNTDRVIRDIEECENMNVAILPPSINESLKNFTVAKPGEIRFGLSAIKGIGDSVVAEIINARELEGEFKTFGDLIARLPAKVVNKKSLEALAKSGALSQFEDPKTIIENTEVISKFARSSASQNKQTNQESLFDSEIIEVKPELALENKFKSKTIHRLNWEKEVLGLFVSDHPLKNMENYFAHQGVLIAKLHSRIPPRNPVTIGGILANFRKITTKTKAQMATFTLEDPSGKIDVVAFPKTYGQYAEVFSENGIFIIKGKWDRRNGSLQVVADSIEVVEFDLAKSKSQELPPLKIKASLAEQTKESSLTVDPGIISKSNYSSSQVKTQDQIKKDSIYRIKIPKGTDRKALMQINEACQNCPGSDTLQLEVEGKRFTLPKKVNYSRFLKREVGSILGVESLAVA